MKCLICGMECKTQRGLSRHISSKHSMSKKEYSDKFNLDLVKYCKTCGKILCKKCLGNYCGVHRDRSGKNNPFFGKSHSKETKLLLKEKCAISTKKLWKQESYRKSVINGTTGKKRCQKFKNAQRFNALKQFKNKAQRKLRSDIMRENWRNGKIAYHASASFNKSKMEKELFNLLKDKYNNVLKVHHKTLHIENKWYYPDITINNELIIEFNGDYWHANPNIYEGNDIVHHNKFASDIWEHDNQRKETFFNAGYKTLIIWEKEFLHNRDKTLSLIYEWISKNIKSK